LLKIEQRFREIENTERFLLAFESRCESEPQEPGRPRVSRILNDVVLAPLPAEKMPDDRHRERERQAVRVVPDLLRERPRRFHKIGEGKASWGHRVAIYLAGLNNFGRFTTNPLDSS
jgi:hypothetical protein